MSRINASPFSARHQSGFTLLEIVVAFSILAVGLTVAAQIATGAMRQTRLGADHTDAALYAQSFLDAYGVGKPLEEGEDSGEFNEKYRYDVLVEPYTSPLTPDMDPSSMPATLMKVTLTVRWGDGDRERHSTFETLRAMNPSALVNKQ